MSHTFLHGRVGFIHDGDALLSPESSVDICVGDGGAPGEFITVPAGALVAFVASLVASERITEIEQAEPLAILCGKAAP